MNQQASPPVWDGNEKPGWCWRCCLFGAFPLACAVIIDALTIPLTLMLIGLIFRGVAFEFRLKQRQRTVRSGIKPLLAFTSGDVTRASRWVPS